MSIFFEVKASVKDEEGKMKIQSFVTKQSTWDLAGAVADAVDGADRVTNIAEKNWVDVFIDDTKESFYELKVEWLDLEGKIVKESYLQQADSTKEAETLLLDKVSNDPEIVGNKKTNIKAYLN